MRQDTALLVVDVQVGMFLAENPVYAGAALLSRISELAEKARACDVPIVYVQHNAGPGKPLEPHTAGWNIHPDIAPAPEDMIIQKTTPDSFYRTNLQSHLEKNVIKKLVLTGIQTELCVDTTCRSAFSLGYDVTVVTDAHSTWNRGHLAASEIIAHHNDLLRWFAETYESANIEFC